MSLRGSAPGDDPVRLPGADGMVRPDYDGAWLGAVVPALAAGRAPPGAPPWVASASPVVLLLVDGLGWHLWRRFAGRLPSLADAAASTLTTVVPSTTATALPSLTTGRTPAEHGMLGDRMRVGGRVLNVLQWTVRDGAPPDPATVQPHAPFPGAPVAVVSNERFRGSGFSRAHLRGADYHGYGAGDDLVSGVEARLRAGARLVYAYLPDLDRAAHERGLDDETVAAAVDLTNRTVARLRTAVPDGGAVLVTSDHGHVTIDPERRIDLRPLQPMLSAVAGSPRLRYLHARQGARHDLRAAAAALVHGHADVYDRARFVEEGWLGRGLGPLTAGRLGDVVLAARGAAALTAPDEGHSGELVTMHGSMTADEMLVPLLSVRPG